MTSEGYQILTIHNDRLRACGVSHRGQWRKANEDCIFLDDEGSFVLLADGMGGHERGGEASTTAVDVIRRHLNPDAVKMRMQGTTDASGQPAQVACMLAVINEAVEAANTELYDRNRREDVQRFMGTTVVGLAAVSDGFAVWFHVGDSRLYRWHHDRLMRLTVDHSLHSDWEQTGKIGPEPPKNIITRAIGPGPFVHADTGWQAVQGGDLYLLCSDGLTDMLSDEQIGAIFQHNQPVEKIARRLVDEANDAGGRDNISVVVCSIGSDRIPSP